MRSTVAPRETENRAPTNPILICLTLIVGAYALLFLSALMLQRPIYLVQYVGGPGVDFHDFWNAARDVLNGSNPYGRARFVTPPASVIPFIPLAFVPLATGVQVFFAINLVALGGGIGLLSYRYALPSRLCILLLLTALLSSSGLMLLERGNLDGLVFLAVCAFFSAIDARYLAGSVLAMAALLKVYPAALLGPSLVDKRFRLAGVFAAIVGVSIVLFPSPYQAFVVQQIVRSKGMRLDENMSVLSLFWLIANATGVPSSMLIMIGALVLVAVYGAFLILDARIMGGLSVPRATFLLSTYVVFFVNFPALVYLYSGVNLIVMLTALSIPGLSLPTAYSRSTAVFIALAFFPGRSFDLSFPHSPAYAMNLIPPIAQIGLLFNGIRVRWYFHSVAPKRGADSGSLDSSAMCRAHFQRSTRERSHGRLRSRVRRATASNRAAVGSPQRHKPSTLVAGTSA